MEFRMIASLPASNLQRARAWYANVLGVQPSVGEPGGTPLFYMVGGSAFMLYESAFAGSNKATAAGIAVEDFDGALATLRAAGVTLEEYDLGDGMATVEGVMTSEDGHKTAWFKDSEGNILGLAEMPT